MSDGNPKAKIDCLRATVVKTYKLSRKTILNSVGVVKLILGKKVWLTWDLDLGKPEDPKQRPLSWATSSFPKETADGRD